VSYLAVIFCLRQQSRSVPAFASFTGLELPSIFIGSYGVFYGEYLLLHYSEWDFHGESFLFIGCFVFGKEDHAVWTLEVWRALQWCASMYHQACSFSPLEVLLAAFL
jgi:hypothetical protein